MKLINSCIKNICYLFLSIIASLILPHTNIFAQEEYDGFSYKDSLITIAKVIDFTGKGNRDLSYNMIDIIDDNGFAFTFPSFNNRRTTAIAVSPNNKYFANGSIQFTLWDVYNKLIVYNLNIHKNYINTIEFSPDNTLIASGDKDGVLNIIETKTGILVRKMYIHRGGISKVAFSQDGKFLITAGVDKIIRIWKVSQWKSIRKIVIPRSINNVRISPDSKKIAVCMAGGKFQIINLENSTTEIEYGGDTTRKQKPIIDVIFYPSNDQYITISSEGNYLFWNAVTHKISHKIEFKETNMTFPLIKFCEDGRRYVTTFFDANFDEGFVRSSDSKTNEIVTNIKLINNFQRFYVKSLISSDMKNIFALYQDIQNQTSDIVLYNMEMSHLLCE